MAEKFYYGGQAVLEGVMMRGQKNLVTAVRNPGGEITTEVRPLHSLYTSKWRKMPVIRGAIVLIESMILGIQSLIYSANIALKEEEEELSGGLLWLMLLVSLGSSVALFFLAPLFITNLMSSFLESAVLFNLIEGIVRLVIFVIYIKLVTLTPDIKRVFGYHGAEHATINAFEAGVPLELERAAEIKTYSTAHLRCGTSFLLAVMVIAILVFSLIGKPAFAVMFASRIILVPVIAALSYEFTRFSAGHCHNPVVRFLIKPGLALQSLTTRQPDIKQIEVAITALKKTVEMDNPDYIPQKACPECEAAT
ncbi:hypothetical protein B1774_05585 [Dehalococcoides mccartyi]|uniref:DUF1385 domain-containing protein n=2 Tax=Dehalococcoides mccartyi TaxID=61435 RepID=A0A0V8M2L4_9CHLR|nr:DUF1385 domain-containing protein [Dehalococcoides mccartyi]AAW39457.1 membrane protein, putative [Dehalococcoides mccartyi 195]AQU03555.1 hypothetical protein B1773_05935 [Dehalococcoides mccartyi]AQU04855.1 hypothetical protein B1774_05585 [Dehalococcoides mccartyi]KSV18023.1 hypothetical protein DA01_05110 [Dehalococcoides mccartyi]OBW61489.1 MAG: hypothetical protein A9181_00350 [Dehalococcoides mccartyi]